MNHPVKRYKPNEEIKTRKHDYFDLYAGQPEQKVYSQIPVVSSMSNMSQIVNSKDQCPSSDSRKQSTLVENTNALSPAMQALELKQEPSDDTTNSDDKTIQKDLYTIKGLEASIDDLEQIFDNSESSDVSSNDDAIHINTPPDSNTSVIGLDEVKRCMAGNSGIGILRPEELSKMFPTPPSLEHHPNASPSGGIFESSTDVHDGPKIKKEIINFPNLGSPMVEPIEDWSYVFTPPSVCKYVGSTKYAPLTNLPSSNLPSINISSNCIYQSTWNKTQQQQQQQQQPSSPLQITNNGQDKVIKSMSSMSNSNLMFNNTTPVSRPTSAQTISSGNTMISATNMQVNIGNSGGQLINSNSINMFQNISGNVRPGMSPISPSTNGPPFTNNITGSPMNINLYRRTPIPPPPPYDQAIASPATSTSSYLNKQFHSEEPPVTPSANNNRTPEASSLLVNILLYDTALNIFRDHNFDICPLCVCNESPKCIGNIRGADSGVYLSLPGQSLNSNSTTSNSQYNNYSNIYGINCGSETDSPSVLSLQNGYVDEDPIRCTCGFSAVINRRLAHRSGLFYEDEMEITGMAEDPVSYKKNSILAFLLGNVANTNNSSNNIKLENSQEYNNDFMTSQIIDLLREQCTIVKTSSSSIHRAVERFKSIATSQTATNRMLHVLEYSDALEVITLALEQSRIVFESTVYMNHGTKNNDMEQCVAIIGKNKSLAKTMVHRWPYLRVNGPKNNQEIIRVMTSMQPLLQDAFHGKNTSKLWDAPYTVKGPLTWRQFHFMAGRCGTGQCEPQPIPTIIVGHEKDWLSVAPYAIQYWDKLLLEPYSYPRDVVYVVIAPDNDYIVSRIKTYFKELSTTYEMCKFGRHTPMKGWDGILKINKNSKNNTEFLDDWFSMIGDSRVSEMLKMYAIACQQFLVPYLAKIPNDKSLLDPPESTNSNLVNSNKDRSLPSPMLPPSTPESMQLSQDKAPGTPKSENGTVKML